MPPHAFRRREAYDPAQARDKTGTVGLLMMLAGALYCLVGLGGALLVMFGVTMLVGGIDPQTVEFTQEEVLVMMAGGLVLACICFSGGPLVLYGGYKLRSLQKSGWTRAGVIASIVLGCVALVSCMILGVPLVLLGVWGIVTLNDPDVKTAMA